MIEELIEKEAIRSLLAEYCFCMDHLDFDGWADLYTEDGIFHAHSRGAVQGRENIKKFIMGIVPLPHEGPARKHFCANIVIDLKGQEANVKCYWMMARQSPGTVTIGACGRYFDHVVKVNGRWKFKKREITVELAGDFGTKVVPVIPQ